MPFRVSPPIMRPQQPTVRVRPLTDVAKKFVRHHPTGAGFNDDPAGTVWPDDAFTSRRVRDGDIEIVEEAKEEPTP